MAATLEVESTLTDRYQTTVPETVRRALKLGKRDKIHYTIRPSGEVVLTRVEASDGDDPVLGQFLGFLAADITRHPERLQSLDTGLVQRLESLVGGVEVDLDAPCRQTMSERREAQALGHSWLDCLCSSNFMMALECWYRFGVVGING